MLREQLSAEEVGSPGYMSINLLAAHLGISRASVYRWVSAALLPRPVKLGPSQVGFPKAEVRAALAARPRALSRAA